VVQLEKWLASQNIDLQLKSVAEKSEAARQQSGNELAMAQYMMTTHEGSVGVLKQAQKVYAIAFHEIVRQVSTYCVERGVLLARFVSLLCIAALCWCAVVLRNVTVRAVRFLFPTYQHLEKLHWFVRASHCGM